MERALALVLLLHGCLPAPPGRDFDGDGASWPEDCDDGDKTVHPGAEDVPYDGVDQDCKGDSDYDADGDGVDAEEWGGTDCDDEDPGILPGAKDAPCDGVDQDCDGAPEGDLDGDGVEGEDCGGDDCDDGDASVLPGAPDGIDGVDNDCDEVTDEVPWSGGPWDVTTLHTGLHGQEGAAGGFGASLARPALDAVGTWDITEKTLTPDRDGLPDLLVGAPWGASAVFLVPGGEAADLALADVVDRTALRLNGGEGVELFGGTVTWVPDLEGDGVPEVLVGSPCVDGSACRGHAYLFPSLGWGAARVVESGEHELSFADARLVLEGEENGDGFGGVTVLVDPESEFGVGAAVGSPLAWADFTGTGWKYPGSIAVFDAMGLRSEGTLGASEAALRLDGTEDHEYVGYALPVALDFDGTGLVDLVVSAPGSNTDEGMVAALPGEDLAGGAWEIDDLPYMVRGADTRRIGQALAAGGDMDGDGYPDLAVLSSDVYRTRPTVEVLSGAAWRLAPEADSADVRLLRVDWENPVVLGEDPPMDLSGSFNGDGYADLALGAPGAPLEDGDGPVLVFFGGPDVPATADTAQAKGRLRGPDGSGFGAYSLAAMDLAATGIPMLVVGAPELGDDTYEEAPPGAIYLLDPWLCW